MKHCLKTKEVLLPTLFSNCEWFLVKTELLIQLFLQKQSTSLSEGIFICLRKAKKETGDYTDFWKRTKLYTPNFQPALHSVTKGVPQTFPVLWVYTLRSHNHLPGTCAEGTFACCNQYIRLSGVESSTILHEILSGLKNSENCWRVGDPFVSTCRETWGDRRLLNKWETKMSWEWSKTMSWSCHVTWIGKVSNWQRRISNVALLFST